MCQLHPTTVVILAVPKDERRQLMLMARQLSMTSGDYVFFTADMIPEEEIVAADDVWADSKDQSQSSFAKEAFESVFHVILL